MYLYIKPILLHFVTATFVSKIEVVMAIFVSHLNLQTCDCDRHVKIAYHINGFTLAS